VQRNPAIHNSSSGSQGECEKRSRCRVFSGFFEVPSVIAKRLTRVCVIACPLLPVTSIPLFPCFYSVTMTFVCWLRLHRRIHDKVALNLLHQRVKFPSKRIRSPWRLSVIFFERLYISDKLCWRVIELKPLFFSFMKRNSFG